MKKENSVKRLSLAKNATHCDWWMAPKYPKRYDM